MVACMALLSGCTESTIVKPTSETVVGDPNFETQEKSIQGKVIMLNYVKNGIIMKRSQDRHPVIETISISIWSRTRNRSC